MKNQPSAARRRLRWACVTLLAILLFTACSKSPPQPPQPYVAFVANNRSDTVAAVDLKQLRVVASLRVPRPIQVIVRPASQEIWALSSTGGAYVVRFPDLRVAKMVRVGASAETLVFSSDGREAYALDPASGGGLVFLDAGAGREVARVKLTPGTKFLALTPDGKTLVASETDADRLAFVDVGSRRLLGTLETGKAPGPLAVLPNSSHVFVADTGEKKISVADVAERKLLANIETGYMP